MAQAPWYTYPRIDNFGLQDPAGPFWKPDSNVQVPGYYPITALHSGTITSMQNTGFGQAVVTVKLDQPFNDLATHEFYEHLSSWASGLSVGQHVSQGQLIAYNNPPGQVPLGFGFYSGDVYGSGDAWNVLQRDLCPGCPNKLNPVSVLNSAKGGSIPQGTGTNNAPPGGNPLDPIGAFWATARPTFIQWGEYVAIFLLAVALILIGFFLLGGQSAMQAVRKVA